jgi:bacteriocin biosynthesis cyclodehydratase domain-containing protein
MAEQKKVRAPVHLLAVGSFGNAVAGYLKRFHPDLVETIVENDVIPLPETWPASRMLVLASWRPVPGLCELLDDVCHRWRRPFVPLILDSAILRLGPVVIPGQEGCWGCWDRRYRQREDWREEQSALFEYYSSHPDSGPRGFLEPFAMMGAARIRKTIEALDASTATAGYLWQMDLLTGEITTGGLTGIHGCSRCGTGRPEATRGYAEMQQALGYLWRSRDSEELGKRS